MLCQQSIKTLGPPVVHVWSQSQFYFRLLHWQSVKSPFTVFLCLAAARYLAHYADWGVVSAISPEYNLMPFGTIQSFADGPLSNSTGTPYFYIADVSDTYKNIHFNNSVSMTISQAESQYCLDKKYDPEEPTCARLTLFGKVNMGYISLSSSQNSLGKCQCQYVHNSCRTREGLCSL